MFLHVNSERRGVGMLMARRLLVQAAVMKRTHGSHVTSAPTHLIGDAQAD